MKKIITVIFLIMTVFTATGCVQEATVIPVANLTGRIKVPPGKLPTGIRVSIAGYNDKNSWVDSEGDFSIDLDESGRYLMVARGKDFDVNYQWVDVVLEEENKASDLYLDEKVVGEALWIVTKVDYPDSQYFKLHPEDPTWAQEDYDMYDDGSHGDKIANDGIFTLRLTNLQTGSQLYSFKGTDDEGEEKIIGDPHDESSRLGEDEIYIPATTLKLARGTVTSDLTGVNYSEVVLATKKGSRSINVDSDGGYNMSMEGNGKEYLVFRSPNFHIRTIPVDLSTVPVYDVPTVTLSSKKSGEVKLMLIKTDFASVSEPKVVADFTNWQPQQMYDDGTHGDEAAGDGVYTNLFTGIAPGYHKYAFNITADSQVKDPYQESGDSQYSIVQVK
jgi:hypothetical protein